MVYNTMKFAVGVRAVSAALLVTLLAMGAPAHAAAVSKIVELFVNKMAQSSPEIAEVLNNKGTSKAFSRVLEDLHKFDYLVRKIAKNSNESPDEIAEMLTRYALDQQTSVRLACAACLADGWARIVPDLADKRLETFSKSREMHIRQVLGNGSTGVLDFPKTNHWNMYSKQGQKEWFAAKSQIVDSVSDALDMFGKAPVTEGQFDDAFIEHLREALKGSKEAAPDMKKPTVTDVLIDASGDNVTMEFTIKGATREIRVVNVSLTNLWKRIKPYLFGSGAGAGSVSVYSSDEPNEEVTSHIQSQIGLEPDSLSPKEVDELSAEAAYAYFISKYGK